MDFIIEFYKSLDMLNLIIFWGIIVVIALLLIFSLILINKNKKLKYLIDTNNKEKEELPIKIENQDAEKKLKEFPKEGEKTITLPPIPKISQEPEIVPKTIEMEKKFVAEEHVMEYNKDLFSLSNIKKANETSEKNINHEMNHKHQIEMPTKPYQRNVLREMSLNQTSPIGLTSPIKKEDKNTEMAMDLKESLTNGLKDTKEIKEKTQEVTETIKSDLTNIKNFPPRKTEINNDTDSIDFGSKKSFDTESKKNEEESKSLPNQTKDTSNVDKQSETLFDDIAKPIERNRNKSSSEKYLEEVSKKLAEAEVPNEIERTNYELEQEENAIISYKELMEKKDSIQTVDEEDAVISIEELMNRSNQKQENSKKTSEETKLYNISEEEENDNFIKELKQFRNDL